MALATSANVFAFLQNAVFLKFKIHFQENWVPAPNPEHLVGNINSAKFVNTKYYLLMVPAIWSDAQYHLGICDMYFDRDKIIKVLAKLNEGLFINIGCCVFP